MAYRVPGPRIRSEPQLWPVPQLWQRGTLNQLCQARDRTCVPALQRHLLHHSRNNESNCFQVNNRHHSQWFLSISLNECIINSLSMSLLLNTWAMSNHLKKKKNPTARSIPSHTSLCTWLIISWRPILKGGINAPLGTHICQALVHTAKLFPARLLFQRAKSLWGSLPKADGHWAGSRRGVYLCVYLFYLAVPTTCRSSWTRDQTWATAPTPPVL